MRNFEDYVVFLPDFLEGHPVTKVIRRDGKVFYVPLGFEHFFRRFLLEHGVSLHTNQIFLSQFLPVKRLAPIYLHSEHVLIAIRFTSPVFPYKQTHGYLYADAIARVENGSVFLHNGQVLETVDSEKLFAKRLLEANTVKHMHIHRFNEDSTQLLRIANPSVESRLDPLFKPLS